MRFILSFSLLIFFQNLKAQNYSVELLHDSLNTSIRGLSVVSDSVVWVSGSNGYVGKTINGGKTWEFQQLAKYDSAEFRDIEAFDENIAVVMSSVQPACILKTTDGGKTWKEVFRDDRPEIFLDAIDFYGEKGICLGDPVQNWFLLLSTSDAGNTWQPLQSTGKITLEQKLAAFAASGSVVKMVNKQSIYFVTGGEAASVYYTEDAGATWNMMTTTISHGSESTGIFSFDSNKKNQIIAGGGNYLKPDETENNAFFFKNVNQTGDSVQIPIGYISCIKFLHTSEIIACGTNGIAIANLSENNSVWFNKESYNVIGIAKKGNAVYFAGGNGRIAKLISQE